MDVLDICLQDTYSGAYKKEGICNQELFYSSYVYKCFDVMSVV